MRKVPIICAPVFFKKEDVERLYQNQYLDLPSSEISDSDKKWLHYTQVNPHLRVMKEALVHFGSEKIIAVSSQKKSLENHMRNFCKATNVNLNDSRLSNMATVLRLPQQADGKKYKGMPEINEPK